MQAQGGGGLPGGNKTRSSRRTGAERAAERPPVVSRRLRRVVNDSALHSAAAAGLEEEGVIPRCRNELRGLFERRCHTMFTYLSEDAEAMRSFAAYVEVDEDDQREWLRDDKGGGGGGSGGLVVGCRVPGLHRVDRRIRRLLKKRTAAVRPIVQQVEDSVVGLACGERVVLRLPHAMGRMVAHGVAQFHSLAHRSLGIGPERVLVISGTRLHHRNNATRLIDSIV